MRSRYKSSSICLSTNFRTSTIYSYYRPIFSLKDTNVSCSDAGSFSSAVTRASNLLATLIGSKIFRRLMRIFSLSLLLAMNYFFAFVAEPNLFNFSFYSLFSSNDRLVSFFCGTNVPYWLATRFMLMFAVLTKFMFELALTPLFTCSSM